MLEEKTSIRLCRGGLSRLLRALKCRWNCPKPFVVCPWPKARRTRRLNEIQRLIDECPRGEVVLFADEADVHLNPKIGRDWMLQGLQKRVQTPGQNEKRYLAGALCAHTGRFTWVEWERKTSDLFIKQLWTLAREDYPRARKIHLIVDNYKIHKSRATQLALAALEGKVELHFLPPYCPDANRIERLWKDLHDNVTRNHRCRTINQLMKKVRAYLQRRKDAMRHEYVKTNTP